MTEIKLTADERPESASATLRRGLRMMPEFRRGLPVTFLLALIATAGRVVVPIAVQQTLDRGLGNPAGPDVRFTILMGMVAGVAILVPPGARP